MAEGVRKKARNMAFGLGTGSGIPWLMEWLSTEGWEPEDEGVYPVLDALGDAILARWLCTRNWTDDIRGDRRALGVKPAFFLPVRLPGPPPKKCQKPVLCS